ncbi:MAG: FeoA family protein [Lentisphaeria bacterium]|nr:FeoA family protein [Lentisphaeria bacterium]
MPDELSLSDIRKGEMYQVTGFDDAFSPYAEKLHKMGFVVGTPVERAPVATTDPMIVHIRGSRIALRRKEARAIRVKPL